MKLVRTQPILLMHGVHSMFDRFDDELFGERGDGLYAPAVDVREDADFYTVQLEVPGIAQQNLALELLDNVLTIRGLKEQQSVEGRYRRVERSYGRFARSITLPRAVDSDAISANLSDGVLEVRLPKRETARARNIAVTTTVETPTMETPKPQPEPESQPEPQEKPDEANGAESEDAPEGNPT